MRKRTLLVMLAGLAVVVAAGAVVLWPRPAVTRRNYNRITDGMSRVQVEVILGEPSGASYTRRVNTGSGRKEVPWPAQVTWRSDSETEEVQSWAATLLWCGSISMLPGARLERISVGRIRTDPVSLTGSGTLWHRWFPRSESAMRRRRLLVVLALTETEDGPWTSLRA
jgi:hypothetical protein